eukprot:Opistho-2@92264
MGIPPRNTTIGVWKCIRAMMALPSRFCVSLGRPMPSGLVRLSVRGHVEPTFSPLSLQHTLLALRVTGVRLFSRALHPTATEVALANKSCTTASEDALSSETKKRGSFALFKGTNLYADARKALEGSTRTYVYRKSGVPRAKP